MTAALKRENRPKKWQAKMTAYQASQGPGCKPDDEDLWSNLLTKLLYFPLSETVKRKK